MKKNLQRILSMLLALVMVLGVVPATVIFAETGEGGTNEAAYLTEHAAAEATEQTVEFAVESGIPTETEADDDPVEEEDYIESYARFLSELKVLEQYAEAYANENSEDQNELVINFIRTGVERYTTSQWEGMAGKEKTAFVAYVAEKDAENGTSCFALRRLEKFTLPNGDYVEFGHMFGVLNISYYARNLAAEAAQGSADFGGWMGDLCDLLTKAYMVDCTDLEAAAAEIRSNYLGVYLGQNSFDMLDIMGDLDAFYIFTKLMNGGKLSEIMEQYFVSDLTLESRAAFFLANRFPTLNTVWGVRNTVYKLYSTSLMISALEATREISGYNDQKIACCYAWADYLCEKAGITDMGNEDDGIEDNDDPEEPDPNEDLPSNGFYSVFSSNTTTLAPGVTQTIKYANTVDDKQFVYYIATVDMNREDVAIFANYHNNDGSSWGLQTVRGQIQAAEEKHADVENYNVVVGTNADFFDMSTGEPNALMMEGVEYKPLTKNYFFGILKDGTPIIGNVDDYNANKENLSEAVAGSPVLVRDGENVYAASTNYYKSRAPRTCVGITADNKVVLMVLDGRQEPFSCGGSSAEIAQVMLEAGCVIALNLDGGGSSTFVAKQEGEDEVSVVNRPSDGYERKVSSSLIVVSYAEVSNEFDHASISTEADYIAPGASMNVSVTGVSGSGNSAPIPEDAILRTTDNTVGEVDENGVFTAKAIGDVEIVLERNGVVCGTAEVHVVYPDALAFSPNEINAIYGEATELPVVGTYQDNTVILPLDTGLIMCGPEKEEAGYCEANIFHAADESCGIRSTTVYAVLYNPLEGQEADFYPEVYATGIIYLYKEDEASFDFNEATAGDRSLAWKREVSNSNFDVEETVYYIDDPDQEMEITYSFALDMNALALPDNIAAALPVVAQFLGGELGEDSTAWDMLLALAERVSPSTTVTVTVNVDPDLVLDYSEMMINCDYFELSQVNYNEEENQIVMVCNWIKVDGPIDKESANPLCIVTGLKATPREDAVWENHRLGIINTGTISYNARVRSSRAYSISQNPQIQEQYGIYPYDNSENLEGDKGAQFSSTHAEFEDQFILDNTDLEGWVRAEDASMFYYVKNRKLTGVKLVPDQKGSEAEYYYDFGDDGVCQGKYTGMLEEGDDLYYIVNGEPRTGWRVFGEDYYYFDPDTGKAVDGNQTIDKYKYEFSEKKLIDGQWVGKRKIWAGSFLTSQWKEIKGKTYYFNNYGFAEIGIYAIPLSSEADHYGLYIFGEDRALVERVYGNGLYSYDGKLFYLVDDEVGYTGLIVEYYDFDGNLSEDPNTAEKAVYYYFTSRTFEGVVGQTYYVTKTNGLLPKGNYPFDENGQYVVILRTEPVQPDEPDPAVKNGIVEEDGKLYYYENNQKVYKGLYVEYFDEAGNQLESAEDAYKAVYYYFTSRTFEAVCNKTYYMTKTNDLKPKGYMDFDENCQHIEILRAPSVPDPTVKNGIVEEDGNLYFYENDRKVYKGLYVEYYGEDGSLLEGPEDAYKAVYYYFTSRTFEAVRSKNYYMSKTNDLMPKGYMEFDANCQHVVILKTPSVPDPTVKNGIVEEDGKLYFYENNQKVYKGLYVEYYDADGGLLESAEGAYKAVYYYFTSRTFEAVCDKDYYMTKTNDLVPRQTWHFDENCQHVVILN